MRKFIGAGLLILLSGTIIFFCLQSKWYLKNAIWKTDANIASRLHELGDSALLSSDVPVAALLLYDNNIIGTGYNTVLKDRAVSGHAEINALSDAMHKTGVDSFMKLDREKLTLVTSWEPCAMCRGAIMEYNIKHVTVIKTKPLSYWWRDMKRAASYEWNKQAAETDTLQDALFKKHPLYNAQKAKGNF